MVSIGGFKSNSCSRKACLPLKRPSALAITPRRSNLPLVLLPVVLSGVLFAQDEAPAVFTSNAKLVVLHASVADKNGKLINNLPQSAFKVFENGIEQAIKTFRREDIPVSLGILIDSSGSMRDKRSRVDAATVALVKASNPEDEVFVVNFNDEAYLDTPFTSDVKKIEEGLSRVESRGGTAMRDAINMSIDYIKESGKKDKKVILIITDGNDNTSNSTLERLISKAQHSEVLIYAIGLLTEEEHREAKKAKRALDTITVNSGGLAYYPKDVAEVDRITQQVAHEIRNQYTIAYSPTNEALDGTFRQVRVIAKGPGTPIVRTRTGYYARQESPGGATPKAAPGAKPPAQNKPAAPSNLP